MSRLRNVQVSIGRLNTKYFAGLWLKIRVYNFVIVISCIVFLCFIYLIKSSKIGIFVVYVSKKEKRYCEDNSITERKYH